MRLLTRYVFREFCVPLGYCLTGFLSIYVLFELFGSFSRLSAAKPPMTTVVAYFAAYLAPYFMWLAPACLMLATLYTMWNFCRHSELTAMRASGVGFLAIVKPLLVAAAGMALFVAWVNECYVPAHGQWAKAFRAARFNAAEMERSDEIVYHNARADRTWRVGAMVADDATALEEVQVNEDYPNGGRKMSIRSPRVEYLDGQWWFRNPSVFHFDEHGVERPSPVPQLDKLTLRAFAGFDERPRDFVLQNRDLAYCSVLDRLRYLETHPSLAPRVRLRYTYDIWSQALAPLACLVITLFAIPAGVATGRQSVFRGIMTALGMFFAFYACTIGCMCLARTGWVPPVAAAFFPHVLFLAAGGWMFYRQR